MKPIYHSRFEMEFLASDKLRVKILFVFFLIGFVYALGNYLTLAETVAQEVRDSLMTSTIFLFCMALFELGTILFVSRKIKTNSTISLWQQYGNALVEISSPTLLILMLSRNVSVPHIVLNTPLISLYFLIIILSTLRLDFKISLFVAIAGSLQYFCLGLLLLQDRKLETIDEFSNSYLTANAKAFGILLCGLGAAFVAGQIRKRIDRLLIGVEKENRIINLFGQQVSKEIVQEMLVINGKIPSKLMKVCVMFVDIRNFTSYVNGKSPAQVVDYQNAFFSIVIDIVTRHGGVINQFLGDGCMVTFGAPSAIEKPCSCAVKAALEIHAELTRQTGHSVIPPTNVGIGIHVGEAVTGNIGTDVRQQYSITGSVVILAARIEQLNKEFKSQILTSEDVLKELDASAINSESLGPILLKGWNEPVVIHRLA